MKQIVAAAILALSASPSWAEDTGEGFSLMEEGARLIMRGMLEELDPAIQDFTALAEEFGPELHRFAQEFGPAMQGLFEAIDSIDNYMAPEVLPNGDILIRRRPEAPTYEPGDEIEI